MSRPSTPVALLGVAVVAVLNGAVTLAVGYLPAVLFSGGATAESIGLFVAVASLVALLVSPGGAFLLGYAVSDALDVAARLGRTALLVFVVGYLAGVVGLLLGAVVAPQGVDAAGGLLAGLLTAAVRGLAQAGTLTLAVVGGAALGRLRG